jgi:hypothetical protein
MAKGWHRDQHPALAHKPELRHYGEHGPSKQGTGYLGGPSHADVAKPSGYGRSSITGNNRTPTAYKLTQRARKG